MNFNINENIVLFPAPEGPIKAIILPLFISKLMSSITSLSRLYEKNTFLNVILPFILLGIIPSSDVDISCGLVVISFNLLRDA